MAEVAQGMEVARSGEGWTEYRFARDGLPMGARRWVLKPGAHGPEVEHRDAEAMLYVVRGSGAAVVAGTVLPLAAETVVWLERGDRFILEAGPQGLEVLQGYAPER